MKKFWPLVRGRAPPATVLLVVLLCALVSGGDALAKSRHRHRRVPSAEPEPVVQQDSSSSAISRRLKEEQQQNKFKPEFKNCEEYRPEVEEESQRGRKRSFHVLIGLGSFYQPYLLEVRSNLQDCNSKLKCTANEKGEIRLLIRI